MSKRLNQKCQEKIEATRIYSTKKILIDLGFDIMTETSTSLQFKFKEEIITFFPYSGWHTGKSIKDGRGWYNLYKQITNHD